MTYRFTRSEERWKIDPLKFDELNRWRLYHAVDETWEGLEVFATAEAAMSAVAEGMTGSSTWDTARHQLADFAPDKWSSERW
jgi:hypothetical protein